jgi:1-acyl-sn-glycerol-3-phosphate acyltransferase
MQKLALFLLEAFGWKLCIAPPPSKKHVLVDRSRRSNLVDQVAEIFKREEEIAILITPEGTRGRAPYWRTGFYYMALKAGVPIALGYADYRRKEVGIGAYLYPTGDIRKDFALIREFYGDKTGLRPEKQGPIRIREEEDEGAETR